MTDDPRAAAFEQALDVDVLIDSAEHANEGNFPAARAALVRALLAVPTTVNIAMLAKEVADLRAELDRVTKERDAANREAEFQHARAAKWADMLKAAPPAETKEK